MKHNRASYVDKVCQCDICCEANRKYQREYLRKRKQAGIADRHGKTIRLGRIQQTTTNEQH
jgi:hypothetical protein